MIYRKLFGIILLLLSLIGLVGFAFPTGNTPSAGISTLNFEEQTIGNTPSANTIETHFITDSMVTRSKYSGEIIACNNLTDLEQVIDLRISNLDVNNILISINYPFSRTIELTPDQIIRMDLPLPYGVSSVDLSSNDEKLTLQVPPCINRGGSSVQQIQPPSPVPELSTIALTGIGVFGLIFIIIKKV